MELQLHHKRGFTLLEMLIVLMILSVFAQLTYTSIRVFDFDQFENTILTTQLKAMSERKRYLINHEHQSNVTVLSFNEWGNINQAQTIKTNQVTFVFQLGAGRYVKK